VLSEVGSAAAVVPGARVEPKAASVAVHYREAADPEAAREALARGLTRIAGWHGFEVIEGKMVLELVPAGAARKAGVVERLASQARLSGALYAGDDLPDLEAFEALDRLREEGTVAVKIAVRGPETPGDLVSAADITVEGPAGLLALLRQLV
jgi:trehalose 6-phosphate phosphatase